MWATRVANWRSSARPIRPRMIVKLQRGPDDERRSTLARPECEFGAWARN